MMEEAVELNHWSAALLLKFMWDEHAKVFSSLQRSYFTIAQNVNARGGETSPTCQKSTDTESVRVLTTTSARGHSCCL